MHVQAAVVQGQLAAQGQLRQGLLVYRFAGLLQQGFEDAAFRQGQADFLLADADHAAGLAVAEVAELQLADRGRRQAAAQHGIPVLADRAEVGANLQDHVDLFVIAECTGPHTYDRYAKPHWAAIAAEGDGFSDLPGQVGDAVADPALFDVADGVLFLSSARWTPALQARLNDSVWTHCRSWYRTEGGKVGVITLNRPKRKGE